GSTAIPAENPTYEGLFGIGNTVTRSRAASVALTPSGEKPRWPFPATVVIVPSGPTLRMRWFCKSAIYRLPLESTATLAGILRLAWTAGPPSPPKPTAPPATVVVNPFWANAATARAKTQKKRGQITKKGFIENLRSYAGPPETRYNW